MYGAGDPNEVTSDPKRPSVPQVVGLRITLNSYPLKQKVFLGLSRKEGGGFEFPLQP